MDEVVDLEVVENEEEEDTQEYTLPEPEDMTPREMVEEILLTVRALRPLAIMMEQMKNHPMMQMFMEQ